MSQSFIDALMHFFSLLFLPLPGKKPQNIRSKLTEYFEKAAISYPVDECLKIFNSYTGKYYFELTSHPYTQPSDISGIRNQLLHEAGNKSQNNLYLQERLLIILSLLEFNRIFTDADEENTEFIRELSTSLNLIPEDFRAACDFIRGITDSDSGDDLIIVENQDKIDKLEGVWIEEHKRTRDTPSSDMTLSDRIRGEVHFRYFPRHNYLIFRHKGKSALFLNDKRIWEGYLFTLRKKDHIQFEGLEPVYYDEIEELFSATDRPPKITLSGNYVFYRYKTTHFSIKPFSFTEESGQLTGILGNNGSGKSTILKLISNQLTPTEGKVFINDSDLAENSYKLKSAIAYISHEDLLFPELTVYENLYYHAQLTLGSLSEKEINKRITETLERFSLTGISRITAGTGNDHRISDFQRVCLRIALEMIRNPYVIFLDEPLTGLSYSDSRRLLSILKEETYKGKLIFLTSLLPTAELFNMFDKVWLIDQDGYLIYSGEPSGSIAHFRKTGLLPYYYIQSGSGQVNPEDVIKIVETKKIHSDGSVSDDRLVSPGAWYDAWRAENETGEKDTRPPGKPVPINPSRLPGIEKQFFIYLLRNLRVRFSEAGYALWTLLGIPLTGSLIALFLRLIYGKDYVFSQNEYLPLYIFLSINFIFFCGLLTGAAEMFNDRKRIRRDQSLNLSYFSFQNAKVAYLMMVSGVQTFLFAITGNFILGIKGMFLPYIVTFFSLAVFGNLLALAFSSGMRQINSLYVLIPFLLLPNLLFTGFLIHFDHFSKPGDPEKFIPAIAEFFPSRWAYEAMMVDQYAENPYNKYFFSDEKKLYQSKFILEHTVPALESRLIRCNDLKASGAPADSLQECLTLISHEFDLLSEQGDIAPFDKPGMLTAENYNTDLYNAIYGYLTYIRFLMENTITETHSTIEDTRVHLADSLKGESLSEFKNRNQNAFVEQLVRGTDTHPSIIDRGDHLFKTGQSVFIMPESEFGRARFFTSRKRFKNQFIPVFRFNISIIWMLNLLVYITFLIDGVKYFMNIFRTQEVD